MAGLLQQNPGPELIGMWVARHERGQGVGAMLTRAVVDLATSQGAPSVGLWVTDGNDTARAMYQRLGFEFTSEWALPHDAATGEHQMRIVLGPGRS
jgi:ribosomal protein S18 acetylase RimI-like enzyme